MEERLMRWVLRVERRTPEYIEREEMQREKQTGITGRRAWGFEERLESGKESDIARNYLEEIKERVRRGKAL